MFTSVGSRARWHDSLLISAHGTGSIKWRLVSVVYKNVEMSEPGGDGADSRSDRGVVVWVNDELRDVKTFGLTLAAASSLSTFVASTKWNGAARCGELAGAFGADALVGSCDECDFFR
jgi:hypothetical protein